MLWFRSIAGSVGITATRGIGRAECMCACVCVYVFVQAGVLVSRASRLCDLLVFVRTWISTSHRVVSSVCVCEQDSIRRSEHGHWQRRDTSVHGRQQRRWQSRPARLRCVVPGAPPVQRSTRKVNQFVIPGVGIRGEGERVGGWAGKAGLAGGMSVSGVSLVGVVVREGPRARPATPILKCP